MKYLLIVLLFLGCASDKYIYWQAKEYKVQKDIGVALELSDYMLSGNIVGIKNGKMVLLKDKINGVPYDFYMNYISKTTGFKNYPWDFRNNPKKIIRIKVIDYYVDFDKKYVLLDVFVNQEHKKFIEKFDKDYLKAYKKVFDKLINYIKERE